MEEKRTQTATRQKQIISDGRMDGRTDTVIIIWPPFGAIVITLGINMYNSTTENTYTQTLTSVNLLEKTTHHYHQLSPSNNPVDLDPIETEVDLKVNCHGHFN